MLGRNDYLLRSDFTINITMTCTLWSSDTLYVSGNKRYEVTAYDIAVDPSYYIEKSWSVNTNNNTIINGGTPVDLMRWMLSTIRWITTGVWVIFTNLLFLLAVLIACYAVFRMKGDAKYIGLAASVLVFGVAYVRGDDDSVEPEASGL